MNNDLPCSRTPFANLSAFFSSLFILFRTKNLLLDDPFAGDGIICCWLADDEYAAVEDGLIESPKACSVTIFFILTMDDEELKYLALGCCLLAKMKKDVSRLPGC